MSNIEIRNQKIIENIKLVYFHLNKYRGFPNYEDIVQVGMLALVEAIDRSKDLEHLNRNYIGLYIRGYVERIINRYSNPGDVVYDPFGGLMTVPMTAVKMHRFGKGCELNPDYFRDGVGYLQAAENEMDELTLFDFMPGVME